MPLSEASMAPPYPRVRMPSFSFHNATAVLGESRTPVFFARRRSRRAGSSTIQTSKIGYVSCTWACRRNCSLPGRGPSQADRLIVTDRRFLAMGSPDKLHYPDRHVMREITRAQRLSGIVASHNTTLQVVSTYGTSYATPQSISIPSHIGICDTLSQVSVKYGQQNYPA